MEARPLRQILGCEIVGGDYIKTVTQKSLTVGGKEQPYTLTLWKGEIRAMLTEPYFVPENRRTDALFREMQKNKNKLAILIDEYGGVSGMVTLEDLIEEIVGDIHEEYEEVEPDIQEIVPHKVFRVSGSISLFDLNEEMHLHIDSTCDTLSGYLMEILGYIPDQEKLPLLVETPEADFEVESMDDRVIDKVKLTLKENKEAEPKEEEA